MLLSIQPTEKFVHIPHNVTHLFTTLSGRQLGMKGTPLQRVYLGDSCDVGDAADDFINVTADLSHDWNRTHCRQPYGCDTVKILTCVHFQGPVGAFPLSK